ncbi:SemiSWEET transporter [Fulvivirgaceae bacterium PWU4]|uniref:SemiSWEET transporter n=1 Tax=Chryseosolibacter histidini TaxID=2782349 RepID=A0AAP2DS17_9BACT|nr:SemiSWEET transporter [Chryseosolibacter histidini]MBT1700444.1 SemiSWEET transporter [Chryseosolibacter histidini]
MDATEILGLAAGALTTFSLLPQVIKIYKSSSAKDLSLKTFLLLWSGALLWTIYGTIEKDIPVMVANVLTLILASTLLFFKFRYRNQ